MQRGSGARQLCLGRYGDLAMGSIAKDGEFEKLDTSSES